MIQHKQILFYFYLLAIPERLFFKFLTKTSFYFTLYKISDIKNEIFEFF
jgi:hypothetical protein